ncbi:hypothetical protein C8Q77DRAFT_1151972 [Trametes polyzona]|nr:hypothetical protein C8Q77DRAFT_1151972 [Trametes polyzona]
MPQGLPCLLSVTSQLLLAGSSRLVLAGDTNVTWITPSDGDVYGSGDTIVGRWSADKQVVSPSFRICVSGDGSKVSSRGEDDPGDGEDGDNDASSCGAAVWPTIGQSDGSYFVHMALPNVSSVAQCYLEMVDDFGDKMASPTFSFGASADDRSASETSNATTSNTAEASPTSSPSSAAVQTPNTPQTLPSLDESRMPVPTAAYAVPLSLVVSVILAAGGLTVHQRRKLQTERKQEQASLKSRGVLSRHSTLSFAGFVSLGSRPSGSSKHPASLHREAHGQGQARSEGGQSRSTSVSMMRAWRRDVSHQHERRPDCASRASETTLAWRTDDGGSVGGYTAFPAHREPRRPTREPFHHASRDHRGDAHSQGRTRRGTVPAGAFRAGASPVFPSTDSWHGERETSGRYAHTSRRDEYLYGPHKARKHTYTDEEEHEEEDWGRLKRKGRTLVDPGVVQPAARRSGSGEAYLNASVNDSVMDRYFDMSPVPLSPADEVPSIPMSLSRPERLHVRRYADADGQEQMLTPPRAPRDPERDLYDAVARRISRGANS